MSAVVLFGLVSGQPGGGQRIALSVARAVLARGGTVAALAPDEGPILKEFRSLGAVTFVVGGIRSHDLVKMAKLARIIGQTRTVCVYTHTVPVHETILAFAARATMTRLVLHRHSLGHLSPRRLLSGYQRILWGRALEWADEVVCVSEQVRAQVVAMGRHEVHMIPNGVPVPDRATPVRTDGRPLVGFIGRIDRNKRVEDFIIGASLVRKRLPDAQFVIVGGGADRAYMRYCRDLAAHLELNGRLKFTGPIPDPMPVLRAIDILVLPSILEGHPLVLLEAMALAKTVVATKIAGCRETIEDGVEGRLVSPCSPEAIAAAITMLLESPAECARLGAAARERVRREFSEDRMLRQLLPLVIGA